MDGCLDHTCKKRVMLGDGLGAVLISRSQPKILRKIQTNLRRYISTISRFLHVWQYLAHRYAIFLCSLDVEI